MAQSIIVEIFPGLSPYVDLQDYGDYGYAATPSFYAKDISEYVLDASWKVGKESDLDTVPAGTASITLINEDRRFDPDYADGPYYGYLLPRLPVRIRWMEYVDGTPVDVTGDPYYGDYDALYTYWGYVDGGFEQQYNHPEVNTCTITCIDRLAIFNSSVLPSVFEWTMMDGYSADLEHWWKLDEGAGTVVKDFVGNHDGNYTTEASDAEHLLSDGISVRGTEFDGTFAAESALPLSLPISSDITVGAVFRIDETSANERYDFVWLGNAKTLTITLSVVTNGSNQARLECIYYSHTGGHTNNKVVTSYGSIATDTLYHVLFSSDGSSSALYINGEAASVTTSTVGAGSWFLQSGFQFGSDVLAYFGAEPFVGFLGQVALWTTDNVGDEAYLYDTLVDPWNDGYDLGLQLYEAASMAGIAGGQTATDASFNPGPAATEGRTFLDFAQMLANTVNGTFFQHSNGAFFIVSPTWELTQDSLVVFTDDPDDVVSTSASDDPFVARYERDSLELVPNGVNTIINTVEVTWRGGTEVVTNADSVATYGPCSHSVETVATSSAIARQIGEWIVARYANPSSQVRSLKYVALDEEVGMVPFIRLQPLYNAQVELRRTPPGSNETIIKHYWIEGASYSFTRTNREVTYYLSESSADLDWLVWDEGQWDEDYWL